MFLNTLYCIVNSIYFGFLLLLYIEHLFKLIFNDENLCSNGTRAEYGLLFHILKGIKSKKIKLQLIVTGSHFVKTWSNRRKDCQRWLRD